MSAHIGWWGSLNHGGLLIAPAQVTDTFALPLPDLAHWQADKMRRALTAFDGSNERLSALLDYLLEDLSGLSALEWQKAQAVDARWSIRSFTGAQVKPRRIWLGTEGGVLPVFVPEEGATRQFAGKLGVGRSKQLLSRVIEWLRYQQQPLALVTNGRQWRLVHAGQDYESWCEWDIDLWFEEGQPGLQVQAWRKLLDRQVLVSHAAGSPGVLHGAILASRKGQADLSAVLGARVRQAVEELITASHAAIEQAQSAGTAPAFSDLYVAGSRIVMRAIITLFAESRGLLPVDNPIYQRGYSLDGLRQSLDRRASGRGNERLAQGRSAWPRLMALFDLIYQGSSHEALPVPQYSGALFKPGDASSEDGISRALALLESTTNAVTDRQVQQILRLLTRTKMKVRQGRKNTLIDAPVDFSSLSSEYIGILYEGLLDFELKQAALDDPVIFLAIGNEPALTLSQLERMDDANIKQLFEALKKKDKSATGEEDGGAESEGNDEPADVEEPDEVEFSGEAAEEVEDPEEQAPEPVAGGNDDELTISADHLARAQTWLQRAVAVAGLMKRPLARHASQAAVNDDEARALARAGKALCARMVAPGQFYLVRWGGTRKGAGTFYTRPQLAAPTVRRTLQPLAYDPVRTEVDERSQLENVVEWAPKRPEVILGLKVCDPAMGSGSFLAGTLRYLTDALFDSLHHYKLIERAEDGGVPRMADGEISELLSDELLKLNPTHEGFEEALRAQLKRHIVERCIYGVDLDPLAVELGRMALWVETMDRDLPFGFLDHKLKVGNALVGAWFDTYRDYPAMAWEREGGDKDYQKDKPQNLINHFYIDAKGKKRGDKFTAAINARAKAVPEQLANQLAGQLNIGATLDAADTHKELLKVFRALHRLPMHESEKRADMYLNEVLNNPHYHALKARMDLWCSVWFWPGEQIELAPLPVDFSRPAEKTIALSQVIARQRRFFHWELEFPDVFSATQQGFDALLGNPPWETMQPNSKEYFSNYDPLYRAYGKQEALGRQLEYFSAHPQLESNWIAYTATFKEFSNWMNHVGSPFGDHVLTGADGKKRHALHLGGRRRDGFAVSQRLHKDWQMQRIKRKGFADVSHPFVYQGSGKPYLQKMFLELSHALLRPQGRMGMIVPSGIYTDKGTTELRELFLDHCDWQWLFGFENRDKVFDIDSRFKFCPLVVQKGGNTEVIRAAFMHRDVDDWAQAERFVLAYPRSQIAALSPVSKAVLEIRSAEDLHVLTMIYAGSSLLGEKGKDGWSISYQQGDFNLTSDSKHFPPRTKWEVDGYVADEYGHWISGEWKPYSGFTNILDRDSTLVLSRDASMAISVEEIDGVALPLYEGRMIGQFDVSEKGWVSGKGRSAIWRPIGNEEKSIEPQYLIGLETALKEGYAPRRRLAFMDICSATNARTFYGAVLPPFPCGHSVPKLNTPHDAHQLSAILNSFAVDFVLRQKVGGLHLTWNYLEESPGGRRWTEKLMAVLRHLAMRLNDIGEVFAGSWLPTTDQSWKMQWAVTPHERLRVRSILDALVAHAMGLSWSDFKRILEGCDLPIGSVQQRANANPKGFWRIDKDLEPELRHTVLSLVAFRDLQTRGFDEFVSQNEGDGWQLPQLLCLADYGLGVDERAQQSQPVALRLGSRFLDWQLDEDIERSWQECAAHAALIRRIAPQPEISNDNTGGPDSQAPLAEEGTATQPQGDLF